MGQIRLTTLQRRTTGSILTSFWSQLALVASGALAAQLLGVQNRGYLALLVLWPTIILMVGSLGLPVSLAYFTARNPSEGHLLARLLAPVVAIQFPVLLLIHVAVLILVLQGRPAALISAAVISLGAIPAALCLEYGLSFLQGQQRFLAFNLLRCLPVTLYALAVIAQFVMGHKATISNLIAWWVLSFAVSAVASSVIAFRPMLSKADVFRSAIDLPSKRMLLSFGLRSLFGSMSPIETFRLDQAVVGIFLSPVALGMYVVALAFTNLPRLIAQSIGMVAFPSISAQPPAKAWRATWQFVGVTVLICAALTIVIMLLAKDLVYLFFGDAFLPAVVLVDVLLIGALCHSARRIVSDAARGMGSPMTGSIAEVMSWAWLAVALLVLIPRFGVVGVAIGFTTAAIFAMLVAVVHLSAFRRPKHVGVTLPQANVLVKEH